MISVRDYWPSDFAALKKIHARRGLEIDFNVLKFPVRFVAVDGKRVIGAAIGRESMQSDLLIDPEFADPLTRWNMILYLLQHGATYLRGNDIHAMHCFVPHEIERSYGRRLMGIGFAKEPNATFVREV